jgi:NADH-quinone oxidoreductase subunit E
LKGRRQEGVHLERRCGRQCDYRSRIHRYRRRHIHRSAGALLGILQRVQGHDRDDYLPAPALEYLAAKTSAPLLQIYSVVAFYALFNREPQGRNTVCIRRGAACHMRGSRDFPEATMMCLGLPAATDGEAEKPAVTTPNGAVTLRKVPRFGQCGLARGDLQVRICGGGGG